jgi:hypothetical protein
VTTPKTGADPATDPASSTDRRTATGAVVTVLLALAGLAGWVVLSDAPRSAPASTASSPDAEPPAEPTPSTSAGPTVEEAPPAAGQAGGPLAEVAWERLRYPVDCGRLGVEVTDVVYGDVTDDGSTEAAVVARCAAGAGSPPSALFVYTADFEGRPRILATLVRPEEDLLLTSVVIEDGLVVATGTGYSRQDVPRCCPDRTVRATWQWDGNRLAPAEPPTGSAE